MGLFQFRRIKIEKNENKDNVQFFIDYGKMKNQMDFIQGMILCLADKKPCLLVLDTKTFYIRNTTDREDKVQSIRMELEKQELNYRELVTKEVSEHKLLGIKTQSSEKENSYKIGVEVHSDKLKFILSLAAEENAFCYILGSEYRGDEAMNKFVEGKGDYDSLNEAFGISLYFDTFFKRIRIYSGLVYASIVEEKLNHYIDGFQKH